MPNSLLGQDVSPSADDQLNVRIAWYYYITDMTQQQIADRLGITRVRVNKALAACRESGVVQIRINSKLASCVSLEYELERKFGLSRATVVPSPEDERFLFRVLGVGAAPSIHDQVQDGCTLGVGWGRTLRHVARETRGRPLASMTVVSLLGGLNYGSGVNTAEIASSVAGLFGASYYYLAAPVYASSEPYRDMIMAEEPIRDVFEKARNVDIALVTVGDLSKRSLMIELGLVTPDDVATLKAAGAVGDLLGHYLTREGEEVDHPLNRRVVSLTLDEVARIKKVILVSGGAYKADIIGAVLKRGLIHELVTDEATAQMLVGKPDAGDEPNLSIKR
ncbi:MAG TPA: sugar-binding transcriptional regulator [Arenibaculum sp.]|nr:sugar-binding transcriptional regulator [Arenibaculum sp.]